MCMLFAEHKPAMFVYTFSIVLAITHLVMYVLYTQLEL